jgi:hypothetical protein
MTYCAGKGAGMGKVTFETSKTQWNSFHFYISLHCTILLPRVLLAAEATPAKETMGAFITELLAKMAMKWQHLSILEQTTKMTLLHRWCGCHCQKNSHTNPDYFAQKDTILFRVQLIYI